MAQVEVIKSPHDKKLYRHLTLPSGLTVLLISDPEIHGNPVTSGKEAAAGMQNGTKSKAEADADSMDEDEDNDDDEGDEGESGDGMDEDEDEDEDDENESATKDGSGDESGDLDEEVDEEGSAEASGKKHKGPQKKAAAAMAVGIGSFSDPEHMQGLSHYLEHMLFMGSEKYPNENEYDDFLSKNGGASNAFTDLEYTNYHFDVAPEALHGALDRFAQFFIAPLCLADSLEREVLAVDSEFSGVLQNDSCRLSQLMCHTARNGHVYRKFAWGNKKSLWDLPNAAGTNIRDEILKYYKQHYTAERMSLVVLGGEPLDTLQQWVSEIFTGLPTGKGLRPSFKAAGMPFEGRVLYTMPAVKDHHEVNVTFQLPCLHGQYAKKADHYLSHLVGHEGPGSLLSALKAHGWATEVCAGIEEDGYNMNSCCYLFSVGIALTEAGLAAGPGLGLASVGLLFQYLQMLRTTGPQEWVWQELRSIAEMKFLFQEEDDACDTVTRLASGMHLVQPQHVLVADFLHEEYNPHLICQLLDQMHPSDSSYRVDLLTKSYSSAKQQLQELAGPGQAVCVDTEPWFQMEAAWAQIPTTLTDSWAYSTVALELHLPPPNPYVPKDFALKGEPLPEDQAAAELQARAAELQLPVVLAMPPQLLQDEAGLRLWHKLDCTFKMPRLSAHFRLFSAAINASPRAAALAHLTLKLVDDALNEDAYLADVAGLHYHTTMEGRSGIEVKVEGFSHKLPLLTCRIFDCLVQAEFQATTFENVKEALMRKYRNMNMQVPKHANYVRLYALCANAWHSDAVLPELERLMLADVKPFVETVLQSCHIEVLAHGNMLEQEARELAGSVRQLLGAGCCLPAGQRQRDQCVNLEENCAYLYREAAKNPEEENCGLECYFQCCPGTSYSDRAMLDLVDQLVYEPCYNQLRTKEQLGYTVHSGTRLTHGVLGFCFSIVSAKHPSEHLDQRVEAFIASFADKLMSMSEDEFQKQKAAVLSAKLQRDRSLADEASRHWEHVWNQRYNFLQREYEVAAIEAATLDQVRVWFHRYLPVTATHRRKLSVQVQPTRTCPAASTFHQQAGAADGAMAQEGSTGAVAAAAASAAEEAASQKLPKVIDSLDTWKLSLSSYPMFVGPEPEAL